MNPAQATLMPSARISMDWMGVSLDELAKRPHLERLYTLRAGIGPESVVPASGS